MKRFAQISLVNEQKMTNHKVPQGVSTIKYIFFSLCALCLCGYSVLSAQSYPWPLFPMDQQHRISAAFGECRGDRDHFHNGTDIPLGQGGKVLNVEEGEVRSLYPSGGNAYIRVGRFAYVHVDPDPALEVGDQVPVGEQVGVTNAQNHIHLNQGNPGSYGNSLEENSLTPFEDPYGQHIYSIEYYTDGPGKRFSGNKVTGSVEIVVRAGDTTDTRSSIDMNNGVYRIGYQIFESDRSTPVTDMQISYHFDHIYYDSQIKEVYAAGSNTSIYRYIVTNKGGGKYVSNRFWDTSELAPGEYYVGIYTEDTRDNSDTTFFPVQVMEQDTTPPAPPALSSVGGSADTLQIRWDQSPDADLAGYRFYFSYDGESWTESKDESDLGPDTTGFSVPGFPPNSNIYFYLEAVDNAPLPNVSDQTDVYGARNSAASEVLIVDGFDRDTGYRNRGWHAFAVTYGQALNALGHSYHTVSNDAVIDGAVKIERYPVVLWMLGDDRRDFGTLSPEEQNAVRNYLEQGGKLLISGTRLASDLWRDGSSQERDFFRTYLKTGFQEVTTGHGSIQGAEGSFLSGFTAQLDTVAYPADSIDALQTEYDGEPILTGMNGEVFGTGYRGTVGEGTTESGVVVSSIPVSILGDADAREEFLTQLLTYFNLRTTGIAGEPEHSTPADFQFSGCYPNPFNQSTQFNITTTKTLDFRYSVHNLTGRRVYTSTGQSLDPGEYTFNWSASGNPSGIYLVRLTGKSAETGKILCRATDKVLLLK